VSGNTPLHPELVESRRQLEAARADAQKLTEGLDDARFNWSPAVGRWSIAECIDHLNSGWMALPRLDRAIAEAPEHGHVGPGPYRHGLLGNLYLKFVEPPPKVRVPAPKRYRPKPGQAISDVVPRFLRLQDALIERVEAAAGLDLGRIRIRSPISKRFRMSLGQWFAFLAAHERRHLWQAWQVRKHPGFPG
jgi:hypothetical protein